MQWNTYYATDVGGKHNVCGVGLLPTYIVKKIG